MQQLNDRCRCPFPAVTDSTITIVAPRIIRAFSHVSCIPSCMRRPYAYRTRPVYTPSHYRSHFAPPAATIVSSFVPARFLNQPQHHQCDPLQQHCQRSEITAWSNVRRRSLSSTADDLSSLLARVAAGNLSPSAAASQLAPLLVSGGAQAEDVGGFAKIDHDRRRRVGFPEVVFGDGKSAEQIIDILTAMIRDAEHKGRADMAGMAVGGDRSPIVATRVSPEKWAVIQEGLPGQLTYHADARIVSFRAPPALAAAEGSGIERSIGRVAVMSAGTSDLAIAEEAAVLAELSGAEVRE